jgi:CheY-like chemotaxis protein
MSWNILVVEDDDDVRAAVRDALRDVGYLVLTASNGAEGLDVLRRESARTRLVLLDLMMPGVNGWQFLEAKNQDPTITEIPVVIVTASRQAEAAKLHKVVGHVAKPFHLKSLLSKVKEICPAPPA